MRASGIVCEYNPFHEGHSRHLAFARRDAEDTVICVMSGRFVQRGEFALFPPHVRAEAAVRCGADLCLELPLPWCLASAPRFAAGAVHILASLGCDCLCFGSESGDTDALRRAAALLDSEELGAALRPHLDRGLSFAAARAAAAQQLGGLGELLSHPNDNLAVEYLRAAAAMGADLQPRALRRLGPAHDAPAAREGIWSASALRARMQAEPDRVPDGIPPAAAAVFARALREGLGPVFGKSQDAAVMAQLRRLSPQELAGLPDMGEGFHFRLHAAIRQSSSPAAAADLAKTRRVPHARIRRQLLCAYLGLRAADGQGLPPYARILAFNERGRAHLASLGDRGIPLITKPARHGLQGEAARLYEKEALCADLYALALPAPEARCAGSFFSLSPVYVRDQDNLFA